jgi:cytochrome c551/c552
MLAGAALAVLCITALHAQQPAASATSAALNRYCATCHNPKVKVPGCTSTGSGDV